MVLSENYRCERDFLKQPSENNRCPAVLIDFTRNRVVLLTAESEAHTKPLPQPGFRDVIAIEFAVQEEVKYSIILFDNFENRVLDLVRVSSSPAQATSSIRAASVFCTCSKMNRSLLFPRNRPTFANTVTNSTQPAGTSTPTHLSRMN